MGKPLVASLTVARPDWKSTWNLYNMNWTDDVPGQSSISSPRQEEDKVEFLSGIFESKSTGTPIAFIIWNKDQKPEDYNQLKDLYRPSHADFTYDQKYGFRDYRGGGRSSARETACRVVGGAIAKLLLNQAKINITAYVTQVGTVCLEKEYHSLDLDKIETSPVRCPDKEVSLKMEKLLEELKEKGDTAGGSNPMHHHWCSGRNW